MSENPYSLTTRYSVQEMVGTLISRDEGEDPETGIRISIQLTNKEVFTDILVPLVLSHLPPDLLRFHLRRLEDKTYVLLHWERVDSHNGGLV